MSKRIYCLAVFAPKTGCEQELFELFMQLEPLALREDGCIRYRVTREINAAPNTKYSIAFHEEWASIEAFEEHSRQSYITEFFGEYAGEVPTSLIDDFSVRIFSDVI